MRAHENISDSVLPSRKLLPWVVSYFPVGVVLRVTSTPKAFTNFSPGLESTPKAFANFSPGLELATTQGTNAFLVATLKALANSPRLLANAYSVALPVAIYLPGLDQPWAGIGERLRRSRPP